MRFLCWFEWNVDWRWPEAWGSSEPWYQYANNYAYLWTSVPANVLHFYEFFYRLFRTFANLTPVPYRNGPEPARSIVYVVYISRASTNSELCLIGCKYINSAFCRKYSLVCPSRSGMLKACENCCLQFISFRRLLDILLTSYWLLLTSCNWVMVKSKLLPREGQLFPGGRIFWYFPPKMCNNQNYCVQPLFSCKLSKTAPTSSILALFQRRSTTAPKGRTLNPRQFLPWIEFLLTSCLDCDLTV